MPQGSSAVRPTNGLYLSPLRIITSKSFQFVVYLCRQRTFPRRAVSHITSTFSAQGVRLTFCVRVVVFDRDIEFFRQPRAAGTIVCQRLSYARFCVLRVHYVARRTLLISAACKPLLHAWQYENVKWFLSMVFIVVICVVLWDGDVTEESAASIVMVEIEVFALQAYDAVTLVFVYWLLAAARKPDT